jgi:hypothetical protein
MKRWVAIGLIVLLLLLCVGIYIFKTDQTTSAIFVGKNALWSGKLIFEKYHEQVNETFTLHYNGKSPESIGTMKVTYIKTSGNTFGIKKLDPLTKEVVLSAGGNYPIPSKDSVIHVIVEWKGQSQRFDLHYKKSLLFR